MNSSGELPSVVLKLTEQDLLTIPPRDIHPHLTSIDLSRNQLSAVALAPLSRAGGGLVALNLADNDLRDLTQAAGVWEALGGLEGSLLRPTTAD